VKLFLVEMKAAIGKDIAEHIMRLAKVISASIVMVSYSSLLISNLGHWGHPMKRKECWTRWQGGK
jgi:hypothetical protein